MTRKKRQLMEQINNLGSMEHTEIFKILQSMNITHSENNNGIFFNLTTLSDDVIKHIEEFVNYCYENKVELDEYDQKLNECKYRNNITTISNIAYSSSINEPVDKKERWKELMESVDKTNVVKDFVEKLNTSADKQSVRKSSTKFLMAKKKYTKHTNIECDLNDKLRTEKYISI